MRLKLAHIFAFKNSEGLNSAKKFSDDYYNKLI